MLEASWARANSRLSFGQKRSILAIEQEKSCKPGNLGKLLGHVKGTLGKPNLSYI